MIFCFVSLLTRSSRRRSLFVCRLNKSLTADADTTQRFASNISFGLFCLGDRAYGDLFCAAGRKWAVRLIQLGANLQIPAIGYGDDNDGDAGVFTELDRWIPSALLPHLVSVADTRKYKLSGNILSLGLASSTLSAPLSNSPPPTYQLQVESRVTPMNESIPDQNGVEEWQQDRFAMAFRTFFTQVMCPATAYPYYIDSDGTNHNNYGPVVRRRQNVVQENGLHEAHIAMTAYCEPPLVGTVVLTERITAPDWEQQNTRHICIRIDACKNLLRSTSLSNPEAVTSNDRTKASIASSSTTSLPYRAGDIATIIPRNSNEEVSALLLVLPESVRVLADSILTIRPVESQNGNTHHYPNSTEVSNVTSHDDSTSVSATSSSTEAASAMAVPWPNQCTLRGWLTYCADIHSLPEREDLRALSVFCSPYHPHGLDQRAKLLSLSEPSESALYVDYIIREKRTWKDVLFDFDSIRFNQQQQQDHCNIGEQNGMRPLTLLDMLTLLPAMRPRDFSLASAPSSHHIKLELDESKESNRTWDIELCVAEVQGKTRLGRRHYHGLCSYFLSHLQPLQLVQLWIRPGSFGALPLEPHPVEGNKFETPVLCIGAGTGVAPMRSILLEREAALESLQQQYQVQLEKSGSAIVPQHNRTGENILVFGCRKESADFYYQSDWKRMEAANSLKLWPAFSQAQGEKVYVQQVLRSIHEQNQFCLVDHIVKRLGAIYIAGNPKMARAVKDEIKAILAKEIGDKEATRWIKMLQRLGRYSVEAWS